MLEFGRKSVFIGLTYTMCVLDLTIVFERFGTGQARKGEKMTMGFWTYCEEVIEAGVSGRGAKRVEVEGLPFVSFRMAYEAGKGVEAAARDLSYDAKKTSVMEFYSEAGLMTWKAQHNGANDFSVQAWEVARQGKNALVILWNDDDTFSVVSYHEDEDDYEKSIVPLHEGLSCVEALARAFEEKGQWQLGADHP
jgi:hypothetical protein